MHAPVSCKILPIDCWNRPFTHAHKQAVSPVQLLALLAVKAHPCANARSGWHTELQLDIVWQYHRPEIEAVRADGREQHCRDIGVHHAATSSNAVSCAARRRRQHDAVSLQGRDRGQRGVGTIALTHVVYGCTTRL